MCNEQVEISSAMSAGSLPACRRADRAKCCRLIYECFVPKLNCSRFIAHAPPTRVLIMLLATPCCDGTFAPPPPRTTAPLPSRASAVWSHRRRFLRHFYCACAEAEVCELPVKILTSAFDSLSLAPISLTECCASPG